MGGTGRLGDEKHNAKEEVKGKGKTADQAATRAEGSGEEGRQEVNDGRGKKSKRKDEAERKEGEDALVASGEKSNKKRKSAAAEEGVEERAKEKKQSKSKEGKRAKGKGEGKETSAAVKPAVAEEQDDFFESD
jgi:hypothetical protein